MSDTNKVNSWSYPFKTAGENSKEVTDPQLYFDALAKAENGYYPLGANGLWHGGVHFDSGTGAMLDQSEIRCIADGEVIAYRIDQQYPMTPYGAVNQPGSGPAPVGAKYSTGFVLVKHRLELPPAPTPAAPATEAASVTSEGAAETAPSTPAPPAPVTGESAEAAPATSAEGESLTFYSLYMHLLDWAGYQAQTSLKRPAFWGGGVCKVKDNTTDQVLGLNVREYYKVEASDTENYPKYQNKLVTLPRGTQVETGEASPDGKWLKVVSVSPAVAGLAADTGWVFKKEMKPLGGNKYLVSESVSEDVPALEQRGLNVREAASGSSEILAVLLRGARVRISAEGGKYRKLEAIVGGTSVPPLSADADGKLPGHVWLDSLEPQQDPDSNAQDAVHVLPTPYKIKAGELIGHLGVYQDYNQAAASPRLHLEVFSCDDVPAFITKSQARAATLPETQKTLIKVHKGSAIIQPTAADTQIEAGSDVRVCSDSPKEGCWAKVQKYATCNAEKSTELGSFDSGKLTYSLSAAQKCTLATRMGVEAADMPDKVGFLKVYFNSAEGGDPQNYTGDNIPSTHTWRKVGAPVGDPVWVERSKLNAQGQRSSTADALSAWTQCPLQSSSDGAISGYDRILPAGSWDGLAHERKAIDHASVRWWYVTVGDATGQDISGWVPEKDLIVTRHSPWEWPGFSTIQEAATPADLHARALQAEGRTTPEEATQLQGRVDVAERGPILQKLYEIIDQSNETGTRDGLLTTEEFKAALGKPWLAQQLSLLIAQYESEWYPNEAKWNDLDVHMADELVEWEKEKKRISALVWWDALSAKYGINNTGTVWHFNPIACISQFRNIDSSQCGCNKGKIFSCVRFNGQTTIYGPLYKGSIRLADYKDWDLIVSKGIITQTEKEIFNAMSANEGNIDSLQSYDSEILTAGAMQKTINASGAGEFPQQVFDFKDRHPHLYIKLFENCGWSIEGSRLACKMFYEDTTLTADRKITGRELRTLVRTGFTEQAHQNRELVESRPMAAILNAITSPEFQEQQLLDFAKRLRNEVLEITPAGVQYKTKDYLKSPLGKATALDHHINRPGYVKSDLGASLSRFFERHPTLSKNPSDWLDRHAEYEAEILEDYGITRRMAKVNNQSVAPSRYEHLKSKL
ncbi:hypothetical protein ACI2KX_22045 [Ectopseudomonas khazarica]|uniref:hypothetical protein n=1 Tax=Ectopseudomonas khazarica TaxID=2502979 RepID=UPI00384DADBF